MEIVTTTSFTQGDLDTAWKWWNFSLLQEWYESARSDPSVLTWLKVPWTEKDLTLEDIRIHWAISNTPEKLAIEMKELQLRALQASPSHLDLPEDRTYLDHSNYMDLAKFVRHKYRPVDCHQRNPFSELSRSEGLVLELKETDDPWIGRHYLIAVRGFEDFWEHLWKYSDGSFLYISAYAVPLSVIENLKK